MNPFYLIPHTPKAYFCDRNQETEDIVCFLDNGANVTLISPRRYGKTGLIYHVFDILSARKNTPELFYVDIYATRRIETLRPVRQEYPFPGLRNAGRPAGLHDGVGDVRQRNLRE